MEITRTENYKNGVVACQVQGHTSEELGCPPIIPRNRMTKRSRTDLRGSSLVRAAFTRKGRPQKGLWAGPSLLRSSAHYVGVEAVEKL